MKPESTSRRLYGITRSKGKMYELNLPEELHIAVPEGSNPEELFVLTIGILGDTAARVSNVNFEQDPSGTDVSEDLRFAASFFDAFLSSNFSPRLNREVTLLASASYYLANRPGSSLVLSREINEDDNDSTLETVLSWLLKADWRFYPSDLEGPLGKLFEELCRLIAVHYLDGSGIAEINSICDQLRLSVYRDANPRDLLLTDIICAVTKTRIIASTWINLPMFSGISANEWRAVIQKPGFPREFWPSQKLLGKAGIFSGTSALIQMPTSAGKTRSIEIVIRSGFMSGRVELAVVVAPFRALCHEISNSLRDAFRGDRVKVNELSDALQADYISQISELFGFKVATSKYVVILTPEKFLYVLRQTPELIDRVGLVIYDEGHQFDTGARGITYELLLTEIKRLLPKSAQTILVSAVIQNARAISNWLIGEDSQIVSGKYLSPTARSVAFASWAEKRGQLFFYETGVYGNPDYFVPRVIEQQQLANYKREKTERFFPENESSTDISLYLGLRLVREGAVAIFCGKKSTAAKFASRAVEIYKRGLNLPRPATFSNSEELRRLKNLYCLHFGDSADSTKAAELGIFCHHGNTPHGIRLAVEYAMQQGKIKFVACTSTLAQGVNLPIRYLIVSGIYQGLEKIKVRDFHNLMGRAGRAGMHTEGLVIFADPKIYDGRMAEPWRLGSAKELLDPDMAEPTSSTLLTILAPLYSPSGVLLELEASQFSALLLQDDKRWESWSKEVVELNPTFDFDENLLYGELKRRRILMSAIESYLMANRGDEKFTEFLQRVEILAVETLAYSLGDDEQKAGLVEMFRQIAIYIERSEPDAEKQHMYAKTLLGIEATIDIKSWVSANWHQLLQLDSHENLLAAIWPLIVKHSQEKCFSDVEPENLPGQLATMWVQGASYQELFSHTARRGGTKPWGKNRRKLGEDDIIDYCENTLGFKCSLIVAAIAQFLFTYVSSLDEASAQFMLFQKAFKYGIPDGVAISCYENGFADRMLAQVIRDAVQNDGYSGRSFSLAIKSHQESIEAILKMYPSYFESVINTN